MKKKPRSTTTSEPKDDLTAGELFSFEVVECEHGGFGIKMDGRDMLLPYGKPFWSPGRAYAEHTLKILAEGGPEHFRKNRTLVCRTCSLFIDFSSGVVAPKQKPFRPSSEPLDTAPHSIPSIRCAPDQKLSTS